MEFDEQLRQAFDQVSARLREEIAGHVKAALAELWASIEADRARAVAEATRDAWTRAEREVSERLTASFAVAERRARTILESGEIAAGERLVDAIRTLDRGHSLSEIMDVLALSAGAEASRAAILLPEGTRLRVWRLVGFDATTSGPADIELSLEEAGIIAEAAQTGIVARAGTAPWPGLSLSSAPSFAELPPDRPALAVPLVMGDRVFAVLYADQGRSGEAARDSWQAAVEVLARHAARSLEAITAGRLSQLSEVRT